VKQQRKHYTAEEKVAILSRHLLEQEPVSKLCDELGLQPTVFYRWQKEFFENGAAAFQSKVRVNHQAEQERIEYLEKKLQRKDEVLAELMEEHVALKKVLGNSDRGLGAARRARSDCGFRAALVGGQAADHLRQRAAVHGPGLQGVPPPGGHDARAHGALPSSIERQNRALAQIPRPQVGGDAVAAAAAPSTGGMRSRVPMALPGETEADSAGTQPCRGIAWRAHRDDEAGARGHNPAPLPNSIGSKDPPCLENPRPKGGILTNGERTLSISR
jgi:transposase